jgi:hypothetical protein
MVFKFSGFLFVKHIKYKKLLIASVKKLIDFSRHGTLFKKLVAAFRNPPIYCTVREIQK